MGLGVDREPRVPSTNHPSAAQATDPVPRRAIFGRDGTLSGSEAVSSLRAELRQRQYLGTIFGHQDRVFELS